MTTLFVSGADKRYGFHLLNLIGSVKANSDIFDGIVVYDLGLSDRQRSLIGALRGVDLRTVPPFVPHWSQGFTWRTWIFTHLEADALFWLDAGATVLRSLAEPLEQVRERGYFVVGQGHPVRPMIPSDYFELYGIGEEIAERESIAGGIIAFQTSGPFYEQVVVPMYEDSVLGRNLGFSAGEVEKLNRGIAYQESPIIRDCPLFRPNQTLLNIHFYKSIAEPVVNDLVKYAGFETSEDHPEQLIWSHRRRGDYRYLWRVPYTWRAAPAAWAFTAWFRARWLHRQHGWKLKLATYTAKAKQLRGRG
jgi:hypothetical protein